MDTPAKSEFYSLFLRRRPAGLRGFSIHHARPAITVLGDFELEVVSCRRDFGNDEVGFRGLAAHAEFAAPRPGLAIEGPGGMFGLSHVVVSSVGVDLLLRIISKDRQLDVFSHRACSLRVRDEIEAAGQEFIVLCLGKFSILPHGL